MPNKLTDAEVKKALECYRGQKLFAFNGKRPEIYIHDIIDLINRQEAEIKHLDIESDILKADVENLNRIYDEVNAENESLKAEVEELIYKLECLLCHATGSKLSKHTYPLSVMESYVDDTIQDYCEEAEADAKAEAYKECIDKVKPIICEIVDRMFDDNESNCVIHDCVKPSKIACNSEICIQENKQAWEDRIDNLLNELVGDGDGN